MKPIYLVGPTASGKSAVALSLAERLNGEIISVDSMQVYRGLNIGTAKPTAAEQKAIPHHLIDVVDLADTFDAAKFVTHATDVTQAIAAHGKIPIFCGGTGLYLKAWLSGLGDAPSSDPTLRAELEAMDLEELLSDLSQSDPITFERIDKENPRRVVRAVEVIRLTGQPFSQQRSDWKQESSDDSIIHCLSREPDDLRTRINERVDAMFNAGLVEETKQLLNQGLQSNRAAMQAIGYRQVVEHLSGERDLNDTIALIKTKTWQFAKRQGTWFRNQLQVTNIDVAPDQAIESIVHQIEETMKNG